jgi:hypothetical protein
MGEEFDGLDKEEQMKAENDFLKLKLMLENGAKFGGTEDSEVPAEIENIFLKNVIEFERQFENQKMVKVFDKIQRPTHFKPSAEVPDHEIETAYKEVLNYLSQYGINMDVCSPNISTRELYRFVIEELFDCEMEDMSMPGWTYNFIYDEFHPDPVHDNSVAAERCIRDIFSLQPLEFMYNFRGSRLELNDRANLTEKEFAGLVNQFKTFYEKLEVVEFEITSCSINETESLVAGYYKAYGIAGGEKPEFAGKWKIKFDYMASAGYWYIYSVEIEGLRI